MSFLKSPLSETATEQSCLVFFRICPFGILVNQPQHLQLPDESFLAGHVRMNQQLDHEGYPLLTLRLAQRAQKFFQCAEAGVQLGAYVGVDPCLP